ncbi:MAG: hypothetical protein II077_11590, partial [Treponema sp.]|nr:hypothetical protein [Treponema sp.]
FLHPQHRRAVPEVLEGRSLSLVEGWSLRFSKGIQIVAEKIEQALRAAFEPAEGVGGNGNKAEQMTEAACFKKLYLYWDRP